MKRKRDKHLLNSGSHAISLSSSATLGKFRTWSSLRIFSLENGIIWHTAAHPCCTVPGSHRTGHCSDHRLPIKVYGKTGESTAHFGEQVKEKVREVTL